MATGGGHSRLNETAAALNLPGMSKNTFTSIESQIGQAWEAQLAEEIKKAGEQEKIAIEKQNTFEGVPAISVIVDGGWSKRYHQHSYNAKSGVAVVIGNATKKLLYLGVRNKYCCICAVVANKGVPPKEHKCFRNWNGSSRAMETDMIVESFKAAESMHGLRYMYMTGDGDSSVLANVQASVPGWGSKVTKVECANHAVKCYRSRLEKIVQDFPKYKGKGKLTQRAIKRLTGLGVQSKCTASARMWSNSERTYEMVQVMFLMTTPNAVHLSARLQHGLLVVLRLMSMSAQQPAKHQMMRPNQRIH